MGKDNWEEGAASDLRGILLTKKRDACEAGGEEGRVVLANFRQEETPPIYGDRSPGKEVNRERDKGSGLLKF